MDILNEQDKAFLKMMEDNQKKSPVTSTQRRRVIESGEREFQGRNPLIPDVMEQAQANILASGPRAVTDAVLFAGQLPSLARMGMSKLGIIDDNAVVEGALGKEGVEELSTYVATRAQEEYDSLPDKYKTPETLKNIQTSVQNSREAEDISLKHSNVLTRAGMEGGNAINSALGLNRLSEETTTDDLEQIAGNVIVPMAGASRALAGGARRVVEKAVGEGVASRVAAKTAEVIGDVTLPGTSNYSAVGLGTNAGVQAGINEGVRVMQDLPSISGGDAFMSAADVYAADDPEDEDGGLTTSARMQQYAAEGAAAIGVFAFGARANRQMARQAVKDIDEAETDFISPVKTPEEKLDSGLRTDQKIWADRVASQTAPLAQFKNGVGSREEYDTFAPDIRKTLSDVNTVYIRNDFENLVATGNLPGKQTTPPKYVVEGLRRVTPEQRKIYADGMTAAHALDSITLQQKDLDARIFDARARGATLEAEAIANHKKAVEDGAEPIIGQMSVKQAREAVALMEADPKLEEIRGMQRTIFNDMLDSAVTKGNMTHDLADYYRRTHPNYLYMQDRDTTPWYFRQVKDIMTKKSTRNNVELYNAVRSPTGTTKLAREGAKKFIENPIDPIESMNRALLEHLQYQKYNDAASTWVEAMRRGTEWGKSVREIGGQDLNYWDQKKHDKLVKDTKRNLVSYTKDGIMHYIEVGDKQTARAFANNPPNVMRGMNEWRRLRQAFQTGIANPFFALTSAYYENGMARMTRESGRSTGMIEPHIRKMFPDSKIVNGALDKIGANPLMNTFALQQMGHTFGMLGYKAIQHGAKSIADTMGKRTSMGKVLMTQGIGEKAWLNFGEAMIRATNDSRYALGFKHNAFSGKITTDPYKQITGEYKGMERFVKDKNVLGQGLSDAFDGYSDLVDTIHQSGKISFWYQNVGILAKKYKGLKNIPEKELEKLAHETRTLSGDMADKPGSEAQQYFSSPFMYTTAITNGLNHAVHHSTSNPDVLIRFGTSAIVPRVAAIALISSNEQTRDWFWNKIPTWQRINSVPIINPGYWADRAMGNDRPLTPEDVSLVKDDPILNAMSTPFLAAARAMGLFGDDAAQNADTGRDFLEGAKLIGSITMPIMDLALSGGSFNPLNIFTDEPVLKPGFEPTNLGFNSDKINVDSNMTRAMMSVISNGIGMSAAVMAQAYDVGQQKYDETGRLDDAFSKAFQYYWSDNEKKLPEFPGAKDVGVGGLYAGNNRNLYVGTEQHVRITKTVQKAKAIASQMSQEKDKSGANAGVQEMGYQGAPIIEDPMVAEMAQYIQKSFFSGNLREIDSEQSMLQEQLNLLDGDKEKKHPTVYERDRRMLIQKIQANDDEQEVVLNDVAADLQQLYGVESLDEALDAIAGALGHSQQ